MSADAYNAKYYALNDVKVDLNTVDAADEAIEADDFYRFCLLYTSIRHKRHA